MRNIVAVIAQTVAACLATAALVTAGCVGISSNGYASSAPEFGVESLRVFLFYDEGRLGTENVARERADDVPEALFNVAFEETEAGGPSSAFIAFVEIKKPIIDYRLPVERFPRVVLTFSATTKGKEIERKALTLAMLGPGDKKRLLTVPFVVHGAGCLPVRVTATMEVWAGGQRRESWVSKFVPFFCKD